MPDSPFEYYNDLYPGAGTGSDLRAATEDPRSHSQTLHSVAGDLTTDGHRVRDQAQGTAEASARNPASAATTLAELSRNGQYAAGLVHEFASHVDTFDAAVLQINLDYQAGQDYTGTTPCPDHLKMPALRHRWNTAFDTLEQAGDTAAADFRNPTSQRARELILSGHIPLASEIYWGDLNFTDAERREAEGRWDAIDTMDAIHDLSPEDQAEYILNHPELQDAIPYLPVDVRHEIALHGVPLNGPRGPLFTDLQVSPEEWDRMVADGTIHDGPLNARYFNFEPQPGGGVVVIDWWIPEDSSGIFLRGDGRGGDYRDPLSGEVDGEPMGMTDSRIMVTLDLETGRASITQSETCTVSAFGQEACNEPREISFDEQWVNDSEHDATGEGINIDQANQFNFEETSDGYRLDWDALNSITPSGSVDGGLEINRQPDGTYTSERHGDGYPAISTTHYANGESTHTVHANEGLPSAIPGVSSVWDLFTTSEDEVDIMAPGPPGYLDEPMGEPA